MKLLWKMMVKQRLRFYITHGEWEVFDSLQYSCRSVYPSCVLVFIICPDVFITVRILLSLRTSYFVQISYLSNLRVWNPHFCENKTNILSKHNMCAEVMVTLLCFCRCADKCVHYALWSCKYQTYDFVFFNIDMRNITHLLIFSAPEAEGSSALLW